MVDFFNKMPQNPYLFMFMMILAIVSAYNPVISFFRKLFIFVKIIFQKGIKAGWDFISHLVHKDIDIILNNRNGNIYYIMIIIRSFRFFVLSICYVILGLFYEKFVQSKIVFYVLENGITLYFSEIIYATAGTLMTFFTATFVYYMILDIKIRYEITKVEDEP